MKQTPFLLSAILLLTLGCDDSTSHSPDPELYADSSAQMKASIVDGPAQVATMTAISTYETHRGHSNDLAREFEHEYHRTGIVGYRDMSALHADSAKYWGMKVDSVKAIK